MESCRSATLAPHLSTLKSLRTYICIKAFTSKTTSHEGRNYFRNSCKKVFLHLFCKSVTEKSPPPQDELYIPKVDTFVIFLTFLTVALVTFALNTETMAPQHRNAHTRLMICLPRLSTNVLAYDAAMRLVIKKQKNYGFKAGSQTSLTR